jgi:predicted nucleotidyltransferase
LSPLSDVDVAVFLAEGVDRLEARLRVIGAITQHLGTDEVDVVILNDAPSALLGRILAGRRVILDSEPFVRHRFESVELRKYFDFRVIEARALGGRDRG